MWKEQPSMDDDFSTSTEDDYYGAKRSNPGLTKSFGSQVRMIAHPIEVGTEVTVCDAIHKGLVYSYRLSGKFYIYDIIVGKQVFRNIFQEDVLPYRTATFCEWR